MTAFAYLGKDTRGYVSYADTDTGQMLIADPGGSYGIRAVEQGLAVPPPDGRWAAPAAPPPAAIFSPPPPAAVSTSSDEDAEGGDI